MPETTTGPLFQARLFLLTAITGLVSYARSLPEASIGRDCIRHAIRECTNALIRIYPTDLVEHAQGHAIGDLELLGAADRDDGRLEISGETVEMYAEHLARYFFAYGEEQRGT